MKIAYFDCFAGAAGDMIAAAMLDAGLDKGFLVGRLGSLGRKDHSALKSQRRDWRFWMVEKGCGG
jgi:uncharacterized protein (DUF111 family)